MRRSPGRGSARAGTAMPRIPVSFDDETFEQVRKLAVNSKVSFAEQVRQLVEFGLELVVMSERERLRGAESARLQKR